MKYQAEALSKFSSQIKFALDNYKPHGLKVENFENILLCGLGGSGIAGRIVKSYFFGVSQLPVEIISDYTLPAYTSAKTLCIVSSYSGDTEETMSMYDAAKKNNATIIAISTGGLIGKKAHEDKVTFYTAVKGFSPRMALGYSLTYLLLALGELFGKNMRPELESAANRLADTKPYIAESEKLISVLKPHYKKKFVIITDEQSGPVGLRFCQQLQENAKAEAFIHELPEANHNVIETYYGIIDSAFIIIDSHVHPKTSARFSFLENLLQQNGCFVLRYDMHAHQLQSLLDTIYNFDWLSLQVADLKGVNSVDIQNINKLKNFLAGQ